jgi:transposase
MSINPTTYRADRRRDPTPINSRVTDSMLNPFVDFLTRRWNEGCRNAAQLWRELVPPGFRGRPTTVRHWVGARRRRSVEQDGCASAELPAIWPVPRGYRLARLLMSDTLRLSTEDELFGVRLLEDEPALGAAITWAKRLNALLRRQVIADLDELLTAAEGQISRLKMLKRTMYGRAGFEPLRARVMHAA